MSPAQPNPKNELDDATRYRGTGMAFLLGGMGLCGVAVYYHRLLTRMEAEHGLELLWSVYAKLYDEYGKWGVTGFNLAVAALFYAVSAYCFVKWWRLRQSPAREEGPAEMGK